MGDADKALAEMKKAVLLSPQDGMLRAEYEKLVKGQKDSEKKRFQKWNGFLNDKVLDQIEKNEKEKNSLRDKIKR